MNLTDVDEINLQVNENGRPEIHIVFNEKQVDEAQLLLNYLMLEQQN